MLSKFGLTIPSPSGNVIRQNLKSAMRLNSLIFMVISFSWFFSEKFDLSDSLFDWFYKGEFDRSKFFEVLKSIRDGRVHELLLFVSVWIWYGFFKTGAENEIELLGNLHSQARLPESFAKYSSFYTVAFLVVGLTISFLLMAAFVNYFPLFCLFFIAVNIQDIFGNRSIMSRLRDLQLAGNSDIPDEDPKRQTIVKLREECYRYWIYKPQIERISLMMAANVFALLNYLFVAGVAYTDGRTPIPKDAIESSFSFFLKFRNAQMDHYSYAVVFSYILVIAAIFLNDGVMTLWRRERYAKLKVINDEDLARETANITSKE